MVQELDRRTFLVAAAASGAIAGCYSDMNPEAVPEVPEEGPGGSGGGFAVPDDFTGKFIIAQDSQEYQDHEPGQDTVYLVLGGEYQGIRLHEVS